MRIRALSVTEVTLYLKRILTADPILGAVSVRGEISNLKMHSSGHLYFSLKDETSRIPCVMFHPEPEQLTFLPQEGQSVMARGSVSVYERDGRYQLYVREMEPEGKGDLFQQFELLKGKLAAQGYFDTAHKKQLPRYPEKLAVVTSADGAAWQDIRAVLGRRNPAVSVFLCHSAVQGASAPADLCAALKRAEQLRPDVIILARGGGSIEELWAFNDEQLADVIFKLKTPVVSGVGHETDFTIADFVADVRAATPSAAAELAVQDRQQLIAGLNGEMRRLLHASDRMFRANRIKLEAHSPQQHHNLLKYNVANQKRLLHEWAAGFARLGRSSLDQRRNDLVRQGIRLEKDNPLKILEAGYAILQTGDRRNTIRSVAAVEPGDCVTGVVRDGRLQLRVEAVEKGTL